MVIFYIPIKQLMKLARLAGIPYSTAQKIEMGITVMRNTCNFEKGLCTWNTRPMTENTWDNFKTHFKAAQK